MIYFYGKTDEFGFLSNTSDYGFYMDGRYWRTVEHYYQAQKFAGHDHEEDIRKSRTVREAHKKGMDRRVPIRQDWEDAKVEVMRTAVRAKFEADDDLRRLLLATGEDELIEASPYDYFWGSGGDGSGRNMLGRLLMELRDTLRVKTAT